MPDPNPYASPTAPGPRKRQRKTPQYESRMHAVRAEFWRGMKFGGACMGGIILVAMLMNGRQSMPPQPLEMIATALLVIFVPTALGAIAGGLIMGVAAAIGYRKPVDDADDCGFPQ